MILHLDYETRSTVDLKKRGIYNYATDPSTSILCAAWAVDDAEVEGCLATDTAALRRLAYLMEHAELIVAHNANFERLITQHCGSRIGLPVVPISRWRCSAAHAASYALPRSLGELAEVLGTPNQKSKEGKFLIQTLSCPRKDGSFVNDPNLLQQMLDYCKQDVATERDICGKLPPFNPAEQKVWELDQIINDRGIPVDLDGVAKLERAANRCARKCELEVQRITANRVRSTKQVAEILAWLKETQAVELPDLTKHTVDVALKTAQLTEPAKRILEIRQFESLTSVAKLHAIRDMAQPDNRVRGAFLYHGAATGRWGGKGIQPHNFPRDSFKTDDEIQTVLRDPDRATMKDISRCLRGLISAPPGKQLCAVDFSAVEGRGLAWLAEEDHVLEAYRAGKDLYLVAASNIYGVPYESLSKSDPRRQEGKVAELALGYQGWVNAFRTMGASYGVDVLSAESRREARDRWQRNELIRHPLDDGQENRAQSMFPTVEMYVDALEEARISEIIRAWRASHPMTKALWAGLADGAIRAIKNPGHVYQYGRIKFKATGEFLFMALPSARVLSYFRPSIREEEDKYGRIQETIVYWGTDPVGKKWVERTTYGGKLTENAVQALCRDLLVHTMQNVEMLGLPVIMHVHDELVTLVDESTAESDLAIQEQIARLTPKWAEGFPLEASGWTAKRYRK
jgi:DNA polymerase